MHSLTPEQRAAIETTGTIALSAAAGSGKTTVLVEKYLSLLARGLRPSQILTVTFTNDAADEMRERIVRRLNEETRHRTVAGAVENGGSIGTMHGFCHGIVDQYGSALGLPSIESIITPFELAVELEDAYAEWLERLDGKTLKTFLARFGRRELSEVVRALVDSRYGFLRSMEKRIEAPETPLLHELHAAVAPLWARLDDTFRARGKYGFDDLENLALRCLKESTETAARVQAQYRYCLVDEFQDTSRIQWEILSLVLGGDRERLFVVGDPKQSIYGFRHADYRLFLSVTAAIAREGGSLLELTTNFRATPLLVHAVNGIARALFAGTDIPFANMESGRDGGIPAPLRVRHYEAGDGRGDASRQELGLTVATVRRFIEEGVQAENLAILFRVSDRIPAYCEALEGVGIPAVARRTTRLFQHYDVLDIGSFLKALLDPLDDFHLCAFLRSSFVGMGERELWELCGKEGESLFEKAAAHGGDRLAWFPALVESGTFDLDEALTALFTNSKYFPGETGAFRALLEPLHEGKLTLWEAVRRMELWEKEEILVQSDGTHGRGVQLMTVHGAKGLEFPHVILADNLRPPHRKSQLLRLDPDFPPGIRYREQGETVDSATYTALEERQKLHEKEESKRILYVALTRAKDTLTILLPKNPADAPKGSWAEVLRNALSL